MWQRPLFWSALFFCAGVPFGLNGSLPMSWGALSAVALAGALALTLQGGGSGAGRRAAAWLVMAGWGACGGLAGSTARTQRASLVVLVERHPAACDAGVALRGTLDSAPALRVLREGGTCGIESAVRVRSLTLGRIRHRVKGRIRLRTIVPCPQAGTLAASWHRGDRIQAHARLVLPRSFRDPGAFDGARYHRAHGIDALGSVKTARLVRVQGRGGAGPCLRAARSVDRARQRLLTVLDRSFDASRGGRRARAIAASLLLGERDGLGPEATRRLQEAGLSHLLAVSGFNVAVLAAVALGLLAAAGVRGRMAALSCLPVLGLYLALNRDESSVTRAVIMAVVLLGARAAWRRADPRNALGVAALAQLAADPLQITDAGFQLTFLATLALLELAIPTEGTPRYRPGGERGAPWLRWALAPLRATLAATAGTLPITVAHFNRVSVGAIPANLAGGPLMSAAFLAVIGIEAIAPLWPGGARLLAAGVERAVDLLFATAGAVSTIPIMSYRRPTPGPMLVGSALVTLAVALALSRRARGTRSEGSPEVSAPATGYRRAALCAWGGWVGCMTLLVLPLDTRPPPEGLRVTAFDVGQGDALLVETPGGERLLVDAGGVAGGEFDIGERVVSRALWSLGIVTIDRLVITHAHIDHAGGAPAIARNFSPREIWVPAGWRSARSASVRALSETLREGTWLREVAAGEAACLSGSRVAALHPPRGGFRNPGDNESSIVLSLSTRGGAALLMGDTGLPTESLLGATLPRARLLKVGHHGSRGATGTLLLERTRPAVALISCGPGNRFGHPHPLTLERLAASGARVLRTDQAGAVEVELLPGATRLRALRAQPDRTAGG